MKKNPIVGNFKIISDNLESIVANLTDQYTTVPSIMNVTTVLTTYNNSIHMELLSFPRYYTFIIISHLKNISTILFSSSIPYNNDIDTFIKIEIFEKYVYELIKGFTQKLINFNDLIVTLNMANDWIRDHNSIGGYFRSSHIAINSEMIKSALDAVYHAKNFANFEEDTTVVCMIDNISKMITYSAKVALATNNNRDYLEIFKKSLDEDTLEDCGLTEYLKPTESTKVDSLNTIVKTDTEIESELLIKESDNDISIKIDNLIAPEDGIIVNNYNNTRILMVKFDNPTLLGDSEYEDSQDAVTRYMINYNARAKLLNDFSLFVIDKKIPFEFEDGHRFKKGDILIEKSIRRITKEDLATVNSALNPDKFISNNKES